MEAALEQLLTEAEAYFTENPNPDEYLDIPDYYKDKEGNREKVKRLEHDTSAAYCLALAHSFTGESRYAEESVRYLNAWGRINTGYNTKNDTVLYVVYKGQKFVNAGRYLRQAGWEWDWTPLGHWVERIYDKAAPSIAGKGNNWGAWGLYGELIAADLTGRRKSVFQLAERITKHFKAATKKVWPLSKKNELWQENLRNNSGMWYTYFALAPYTRAAAHIDTDPDPALHERYSMLKLMYPALEVFFQYCLNPESWPYKKWSKFPLGWLQQLLFPSTDYVQIPKNQWNTWPANLYEALADIYSRHRDHKQFDVAGWLDWTAEHKPRRVGNVWKYPSLFVDEKFIRGGLIRG